MANLTPSMRLKVKRDTFYLPDPNHGVYFRNNVSSFTMEGSHVHQWIEKLMPMFNGQNTMAKLTEGLPGPYRNRVYEIAAVLLQNGFVRDVSQDHPHQLGERTLETYAAQIEFLDSFRESGAFRFERFRQAEVLAVGSGSILASLVSSLFESGLPALNVVITDSSPTNRERLTELVNHFRTTDPEVALEEITLENGESGSWQEIVRRYDAILYVSEEENIEELRALHSICRQEQKLFLPAMGLDQYGMAGPLVHKDSAGCWESAWRRLHLPEQEEGLQSSGFSPVAGALLANVIAFELFKKITEVTEPEQMDRFFLLNLTTLEGSWHSFLPHPLVTGDLSARWVEDVDMLCTQRNRNLEPGQLLLLFNKLTSPESGIFHIWEEEELKQLPLAQCRVQAVNPLSEGPASLLPEKVCSGLNHEEARREAGLTGMEEYFLQTVHLLLPAHPEKENRPEQNLTVGIGAGESAAEALCRGLQRYLDQELSDREHNREYYVTPVTLEAVEDERCQFYLQSLTTMQGEPIIGVGEEVSGFPVVWVGTSEGWFRSTGLNMTLALQQALKQAVMNVQNQEDFPAPQPVESVFHSGKSLANLEIRSSQGTSQSELLESALQILEQNQRQLMVFEISGEPVLTEGLAGVFGVLIREEESS
ncbi:putative thiazole-containing bacteriocin maturation protein [Mesobacillus foraminis]|uniref:putative thiazole-containing bacteriocin maturation protein n=1 Tax=Mesobacillus foraminis TaxID=279826 RepID=UPI000EF53514|nr:putative thiazole-containing bacteriocin maturation protein [Mesobacillus foraminis]